MRKVRLSVYPRYLNDPKEVKQKAEQIVHPRFKVISVELDTDARLHNVVVITIQTHNNVRHHQVARWIMRTLDAPKAYIQWNELQGEAADEEVLCNTLLELSQDNVVTATMLVRELEQGIIRPSQALIEEIVNQVAAATRHTERARALLASIQPALELPPQNPVWLLRRRRQRLA